MINVYLFGKLRKLASNPAPTSDSIIQIDYNPDETVEDLLSRIGIDPKDTGEIFVNHMLAAMDSKITKDQSRVGVFSRGMNLIDGGQHLKGHGLITSSRKKANYY
ncbi:MAG: hypothetical protein ACW99A_03340 [Candidatus Kariarchaeaceae archaeon]|jgi:hypothetical protein